MTTIIDRTGQVLHTVNSFFESIKVVSGLFNVVDGTLEVGDTWWFGLHVHIIRAYMIPYQLPIAYNPAHLDHVVIVLCISQIKRTSELLNSLLRPKDLIKLVLPIMGGVCRNFSFHLKKVLIKCIYRSMT